VSGSGICWAICKAAPHPRQPHQHPTTQFFYRLDALPAAQPTASKQWREKKCLNTPYIMYTPTCTHTTEVQVCDISASAASAMDILNLKLSPSSCFYVHLHSFLIVNSIPSVSSRPPNPCNIFLPSLRFGFCWPLCAFIQCMVYVRTVCVVWF